ncbi:Aste57867_12791 [Aphanomyces stellatus]|uniref:Aste57867_12791 protein n=1 Tax=Aphanomyces stellatus TaxID=120398 RepID=A0A485KWH5_9STRA|nr:hypothetical protein As57867_012743 [Aphanomyces stellatus]VFT89640.1 Aste57867_12791 [Aphanomyces stellatus]
MSETKLLLMGFVRGLALILAINVAFPLLILKILMPYMATVYALLLSGIPSMVDTIYHLAKERRLDIVSSIAVISIAASVVTTFLSQDVRISMVQGSFFTGLLGLAYLWSIYMMAENLLFYYYRQFQGPEKKEYLDRLSAHSRARSSSNFMCNVWGFSLVLEAVAKVVMVYTIPIETMIYVSQVLGWGIYIGLSLWSIWYVRHLNHQYGEPIIDDLDDVDLKLEIGHDSMSCRPISSPFCQPLDAHTCSMTVEEAA